MKLKWYDLIAVSALVLLVSPLLVAMLIMIFTIACLTSLVTYALTGVWTNPVETVKFIVFSS